jgi:integrase
MTKQDNGRPVPRKRVWRPILSSEDEKRLFDVRIEKASCEVAYNAALILSNTLMRAGEIRRLRLCDLDLGQRTITLPRADIPRGTSASGRSR